LEKTSDEGTLRRRGAGRIGAVKGEKDEERREEERSGRAQEKLK